MAVMLFLVFLAMDTVQSLLKMGEELNATMHRLMQNLVWKVRTLLQDVEQTQGQNWVAQKLLLLAPFQQWFFWACALGAIALLLLLWLCWRTRRNIHEPGSSCQQGRLGRPNEEDEEDSPRRQSKKWEDKEEEDDELDNGSDDACDLGRYVVDSIQWPISSLAEECKLVEELVDHLLTACFRLSRNTFKPRLQPAIGVDCGYEDCGAWDKNVVYHLLVPLEPPPGHIFYLEMSPDQDMLTCNPCLHVQLQCMCMREQLVGDMLCFVHHSECELENQGPSLLNTLCANSYLDIQKTACWFQQLVEEAWKLLPFSHHCQLTVLPTTHSCKITVEAAQETLAIEMSFGVQLDNSCSFLRLE